MAEFSLGDPKRAGAVRAAHRALRPLLVSEKTFVASLSDLRERDEQFVRVLFTVERRRVVHRHQPAPGTRRQDLSAFEPCMLGPWEADPESLPETSRQLCECMMCDGEKRVDCAACDGSGKRACVQCGGDGQVAGKRRLKNCPGCRGTGRTKCGECKNGRVECPTCEGVGRVLSWFEVESIQLSQVRVDAQAKAQRLYPTALEADDFQRPQHAPACTQDAAVAVHQLALLPLALRPVLDDSERVIAARAQTLCFKVYEIHYGTALSRGLSEVVGTTDVVYSVDRRPWTWRSRLAGIAAGLTAFLFYRAVDAYRAQHRWFAELGNGDLGLSLGCLAALLFGLAVLGWLLAAPARSRWNTWLPTASGAVATLAAGFVLLIGQPSVGAARAAMRKGDLQQAALVADAIKATHRALPAADSLFDDLRLAQMTGTNDVDRDMRLLSEAGWSAAARGKAVQLLEHAALEQANAARSAVDAARLQRLAVSIASLLPGLSRELETEAITMAAEKCLKAADLACITAPLKQLAAAGAHDVEARIRVQAVARAQQMLDAAHGAAQSATQHEALQHYDEAAYLATALRALGSPLSEQAEQEIEEARTRARIAHEKRQRSEDARLARENAHKQHEAEKQRAREERQARAEEKRAARQERALVSRGGGGLLCNDGTLSPSCSCSGSWRGCCSWHGGVAGCQ